MKQKFYSASLNNKPFAAATFVALVVLLIDLQIPLGVAAAVPYMICVILASRAKGNVSLWVTASIVTILTIIGYFLSPESGEIWKVITNRLEAIFVIWATGIILAVQKKAQNAKAEQDMAHIRHQSILEERDNSIKEIHHRIKNNLQVIISIMGLKSSRLNTPESDELFDFTSKRIESIALVHELLYKTPSDNLVDLDTYITSMINGIRNIIAPTDKEINFELDIETTMLQSKTCVSIGLILNELLTNSVKHGFSDSKGGNVWITVTNNDNQELVLTYEDDGNSEHDNLQGSPGSLGLKLVSSLVKQLHGDIDISVTERTSFLINIPLNKGDLK